MMDIQQFKKCDAVAPNILVFLKSKCWIDWSRGGAK